ncbi:MAG: PHP domain-containing protein [Clostridia bacterium]|nr:PHP domain-containing protein [Clostridia bacterium]
MITPASIDLHMHTTASDGTCTPGELLSRVREAGLSVFAVTDHDAVKACTEIRRLLLPGDPLFIPGVEFSCRDEEGKYHILGYGFDPAAEPIAELVEAAHGIRVDKVKKRLSVLKSDHGIAFPDEEIRELLSLPNPGKPHIGNLMVKYGYAGTRRQAILDVLNRICVNTGFIRPEQAIAAILDSGGVPVLAHPFFGDGDQCIEGAEMERRLARLTDFGLRGVEAFYSRFTPAQCAKMLAYAERFGLFATAGSDFHGANKDIPLGMTGLSGDELPAPLVRFLKAVAIET